ncbi:MAG: cell surface protein, partial [Caulobacter sp.]
MTAPRKRSNSLKLSSMLAGAASLTLAGCDDPSPQASWDPNRGEQVQAFSYK